MNDGIPIHGVLVTHPELISLLDRDGWLVATDFQEIPPVPITHFLAEFYITLAFDKMSVRRFYKPEAVGSIVTLAAWFVVKLSDTYYVMLNAADVSATIDDASQPTLEL